jgi:hypothetical protein
MAQLITTCPVCEHGLTVVKLRCPHCETGIEGQFDLGPLRGLGAQQLAFVAAFVRCEGKLSHLESELGLSYPTLRSRLQEVIRTLEQAAGPDVAGGESAAGPRRRGRRARAELRHGILAELEAGRLTAEEAIARLALDDL